MKGIFLNSRKILRTRKADTINSFFFCVGLTWSCKIQFKKQSGTLPTSLSIEQTVRKVLTFFLYFSAWLCDPLLKDEHFCSGQKSQCESLKRCLEEVTVLYDWDRPVLRSPVKKVRFVFSVSIAK
jgi:hypothetical protein